jgi:hypothetical protein
VDAVELLLWMSDFHFANIATIANFRRTMFAGNLRILIASTEKTGNTWLKFLLARVYDLPIRPIGYDFCAADFEKFGPRWVIHQHFQPEPALLAWAEADRVCLLTTIRHPGDALVSLYHYCCNYFDRYKNDGIIPKAFAADAEKRRAARELPHHIVDGELIRALQHRIMCDLNISISWILSRRSIVVRYEDLRCDPLPSLRRVTDCIAPVSDECLRRAINDCEIGLMRERSKDERRFFRRGLVGEWQTALPAEIRRRFDREEPFKSQRAFLGYESTHPVSDEATGVPLSEENIPFIPLLTDVFHNAPGKARETWSGADGSQIPEALISWANAPADEDPFTDQVAPQITNLLAFIHRRRADLQQIFFDLFGAHRMASAMWFLRYAPYEYQLDRRFLLPVVLSWLASSPEAGRS